MSLPSISIVIPNFNGGKHLEEAIKSVLLQGYQNLEILILDGGSTDESLSVVEKYKAKISYWESERDEGQSHAINKGLHRCTGEIVNWLCSDDCLLPGALEFVGNQFANMPNIDVIAGKSIYRHEYLKKEDEIVGPEEADLSLLPYQNPIQQPSCFFRRSLLRSPAVRQDLSYVMDFELWAYFRLIKVKWKCVERPLSIYRFTGDNKTLNGGLRAWNEWKSVYREYGSFRSRLAVLVAERIRCKLKHNVQITEGKVLRHCYWRMDRAVALATGLLCGKGSDAIARVAYWLYRQEYQIDP